MRSGGGPAVTIHTEIRRRSPSWLSQGLLAGVFLALALPALSLWLNLHPVWLPGAASAWRVAHVSSVSGDTGLIGGVLATQAALIFAGPLIWRWIGPITPRPRWLVRKIVDGDAIGCFQAQRLDAEGPDVLLYVDMARREARIVAGVEARKAVPTDRFPAATKILIAGAQAGDPERAVRDAADKLLRKR